MNQIPSGSATAGSGRPSTKRTRAAHSSAGALRRIGAVFASVALAGAFFSIFAGSSGALTPPATSSPFNECPAIGNDTAGCAFLIILNSNGTTTIVQNTNEGPFDGTDYTLVGIYNNSGGDVSTVVLTSTKDIFAFDGDGFCATTGSPLIYTW